MVPNNIPNNEFNQKLIKTYANVLETGIKWTSIVWDRKKEKFVVSVS